MQEVWILLGAPGTGIASEPHNRGPDSIPLSDYNFPLLRLMNDRVHGDELEEPRCLSMLHYLVIDSLYLGIIREPAVSFICTAIY